MAESVKETDIAAIEAAVKQKESAAIAEARKEATEQVRKEVEAEAKLRSAEAERNDIEAKFKAQQEELAKLRAANDELIAKKVAERMADVEAKSKRLVQNDSPFDAPKSKSPIEGLTQAQLKEVEVASYEALLRKSQPK
jgi:phage-related minor tail protein